MPNYVGLDTSTKTGFVRIDEEGEIWAAEEIEVPGKDPTRMANLIDKVIGRINDDDVICIEDFAYAQANRMAMLGGIGWGVRLGLWHRGINYTEVSTGQLKNYAGCKGNVGKPELIIPIFELWGFKNSSDNVRDAFILAQIARGMHESLKLKPFQRDVIKKLRG
ncbi:MULTISPECIES: hypothetical protein [unclassified Paenibacillus]|uniref:hypothetical protein n=1 Tax=unclassified Paenibacillus TaxID=185978 RepID=UPI0036449C68